MLALFAFGLLFVFMMGPQLLNQPIRSSRCHNNAIVSVVFSPKSTFIATASSDGCAKVFCTNNLSQPQLISFHKGPVNAIAFSSDDRQFATGGLDGNVKIWDIQTGKQEDIEPELELGKSADNRVFAIAFSPNGDVLAVGKGNVLFLWNVVSGRLESALLHSDLVLSLVFSSDGLYLAARTADGLVSFHDVTNKTQVSQINVDRLKSRMFYQVLHDATSNVWITNGHDRTVRTWLMSGELQSRLVMPSNKDIHGMALSSDGTTLLTALSGGNLVLWDRRHNEAIWSVRHRNVNCIAMSQTEDVYAIGDCDGNLEVWNLKRDSE